MASVDWSWKEKKKLKLFGEKGSRLSTDFSSKKEAKEVLEQFFKDMTCEVCGSSRLVGKNIQVEIQEIELYPKTVVKNWLGKEKVVDKYSETVYRVGDMVFSPAWLFSSGGHFKCRDCGHRYGSPGFFQQWLINYNEYK